VPYNRFMECEPVYKSPTFQNGGLYMLPSFPAPARGIFGKSRFERYVSQFQSQKNLIHFFPRSGRKMLPVQGPTIRTLHRSLHLHQTDKANSSVPLLIYLDNMLICAPSEPLLLRHLSTVLWLLTAQGFIINVSKSVLKSTKQIEFLGFTINAQAMTVALPPNKRSEIQQETSHLLHCSSVPTKTLSRLVGKLVATKLAVTNAPLHYRALQSLKISTVHAQHDEVSLTREA